MRILAFSEKNIQRERERNDWWSTIYFYKIIPLGCLVIDGFIAMLFYAWNYYWHTLKKDIFPHLLHIFTKPTCARVTILCACVCVWWTRTNAHPMRNVVNVEYTVYTPDLKFKFTEQTFQRTHVQFICMHSTHKSRDVWCKNLYAYGK